MSPVAVIRKAACGHVLTLLNCGNGIDAKAHCPMIGIDEIEAMEQGEHKEP